MGEYEEMSGDEGISGIMEEYREIWRNIGNLI